MDFEEIVRTYSRVIYYNAYLYVGQREAAEDITQDVLLTLYKKQDAFRGEASLKTYITKITYNRCYDYQHSWRNKTYAWIDRLTLRSSYNTEREVDERVQQTELLQAVQQLKPKYRDVIILYYYNELLIRDIASLMQCHENTVHTRLKRAREQLKVMLKGWEGEAYEEAIGEGH